MDFFLTIKSNFKERTFQTQKYVIKLGLQDTEKNTFVHDLMTSKGKQRKQNGTTN